MNIGNKFFIYNKYIVELISATENDVWNVIILSVGYN